MLVKAIFSCYFRSTFTSQQAKLPTTPESTQCWEGQKLWIEMQKLWSSNWSDVDNTSPIRAKSSRWLDNKPALAFILVTFTSNYVHVICNLSVWKATLQLCFVRNACNWLSAQLIKWIVLSHPCTKFRSQFRELCKDHVDALRRFEGCWCEWTSYCLQYDAMSKSASMLLFMFKLLVSSTIRLADVVKSLEHMFSAKFLAYSFWCALGLL